MYCKSDHGFVVLDHTLLQRCYVVLYDALLQLCCVVLDQASMLVLHI